jgi:hypothetical protein
MPSSAFRRHVGYTRLALTRHSTLDFARRAAHLSLTPAQTAERGTRAERYHDSPTVLDSCDAP